MQDKYKNRTTEKLTARKCWAKLNVSGKGGQVGLGNKWMEKKKWSFISLRWWTLNALSKVDISYSPFVWLNTAPFYLPHKARLQPKLTSRGERHVAGLWLAAFSSLSILPPPTLPDSCQDFVMEMCDGQNSTETMFLAFICRNDFTVLMKTESEQLFGNSHARVCAWYLWSGVSPRPMGLSSDWLRSLWIVPAASWLAEAPDIRGLAIHHRVCVCVCV